MACNIYRKVRTQLFKKFFLYYIVFVSSLMLHRPLQFVDLTKLKTEKSHQAFRPSNYTGVQTNVTYEEARSVAILKVSTVILFRR